MDNEKFKKICKREINKYYNNELEEKDIYVVWLVKVLQNNKALLSTNVEDKKYYEITYNGDEKELYVDAYKKEENKLVKVED